MGVKGYRTGGCGHFNVNNQIGLTSRLRHRRTSPYPSDTALMVESPIFYAAGDDPEAVTFAAKVATEYRQLFGKDVVIDMFCYRRYGHNEGDDPTMTQPIMYAKIRDQSSTRELYSRRLVDEGVITEDAVGNMVAEMDAHLDAEFEKAKTFKPGAADWLDGKWAGLGLPKDDELRGKTGVALAKLKDLGKTRTSYPEGFNIHKTVARTIESRRKMAE